MIKSMTGFGRAEARTEEHQIGIEVRSVNNRYSEISLRLPRAFACLEARIKTLIQQKISRGSVTLVLNYSGREQASLPRLDIKAARHYHKILLTLKKELGLMGGVDIRAITAFPDVLAVVPAGFSEQKAWQLAEGPLTKGLAELNRMRQQEGKRLEAEFKKRLNNINQIMVQIEKLAEGRVAEYRKQLQSKMDKLLAGTGADEGRLAQEAAIYADRCDITEECVRLKIHLKAFDQFLKTPEPVGRRMDFLLQEMNRESNTMGAKANQATISQLTVQLKEEIEKMREQVQNIE
ncbi:YicC family protein [candidate division TA06 bacterium]|uniref:YicC family protein n=1 Tax=candidate division TA06 bacterium TaxID=2250710 RepID=A0A933MKI5_UNCT6|nr:YicC family protein [candidate division TA06 bacterium]